VNKFFRTKFFPLISSLLRHTLILAVVGISLFPLYLMMTLGGKTNAQFFNEAWTFTRPFHPHNLIAGFEMVINYVSNIIFVGFVSVLLTYICALGGAFFFARNNFKWKKPLWYLFIVFMLVPATVNLVPLLFLLEDMGLMNSLWALILVNVAIGQLFEIYVLKNFIEDIPESYFEMAELDNAGIFSQLVHLVIPRCSGILISLGILQFISICNDYVIPLTVIKDDCLLPISVGLAKLEAAQFQEWGPLMVAYGIASLPLLIIFVFAIRLVINSFSSSGFFNEPE
jgi:ABC-type glycerol-3-phosphate transport system permease component